MNAAFGMILRKISSKYSVKSKERQEGSTLGPNSASHGGRDDIVYSRAINMYNDVE
jgi:hypothetical protein